MLDAKLNPAGRAAAKAGSGNGAAGSAAPPPSALKTLEPLAGRMHLMRIDVPYACLSGADPVPHRPNVYYLSRKQVHARSCRWL